MERLDRADIQGNVLQPYAFDHARHLFARLPDPLAGRTLLDELRGQVETALPWPGGAKPDTTLNLALSYGGLDALGVSAPVLAKFPLAFREGMLRRAPLLGDDPGQFDPVWQGGRVHLWLSIHARTRAALDERVAALATKLRARAELLDDGDLGGTLPNRIEHFGFPDGISNPAVEDGSAAAAGSGSGKLGPDGRWHGYAAGEFLLGYPDEAAERSGGALPERLARNGTFVVYRKLEQDVLAFRRYVAATASALAQDPELVAAKLMGRWRNGQPLVTAAQPSANDAADLNDFNYAKDPAGARCPLGAHIRRANPRDASGFTTLTDRHRMLRRGMPYGEALPELAASSGASRGPRGLLFIAMNASLERQFEFVQRHWVNDGAISRQGYDRDPICGAHLGSGKLIVQGDPASGRAPLVLTGLPRFVTTRGGDYFFMPSLTALFALASGSFLDLRVSNPAQPALVSTSRPS
jgi:Dyp-type peroxidase family